MASGLPFMSRIPDISFTSGLQIYDTSASPWFVLCPVVGKARASRSGKLGTYERLRAIGTNGFKGSRTPMLYGT